MYVAHRLKTANHQFGTMWSFYQHKSMRSKSSVDGSETEQMGDYAPREKTMTLNRRQSPTTTTRAPEDVRAGSNEPEFVSTVCFTRVDFISTRFAPKSKQSQAERI
jgi:hypothetical protein